MERAWNPTLQTPPPWGQGIPGPNYEHNPWLRLLENN